MKTRFNNFLLQTMLIACLGLMLAGRVKAAPIPTLFNTGISANNSDGSPGTLTADGATDQHYSIIASVDGAITPFVTESGSYPFPYWSQDTLTSKWVSPQATYAGFLQDPVGNYTYKTTFNLTGFDIGTASVSGQIAGDNYIGAVRINGFDIGFSTTDSVGFGFTSFSIPSGHYASGVNELEFDVVNTVPNGGNPSGLRVEVTGTAAGLPQLNIFNSGANVILTWPTNFTGFTLQSTTNLIPPSWSTVSPAPTIVNTNNAVTNAITGTQKFYRLSQ